MLKINYAEKWSSKKIIKILNNPNKNNILTRIDLEKIKNLNGMVELKKIDICGIVNLISKYKFNDTNSKILDKIIIYLDLLNEYKDYHIYEETLNLILHKNSYNIFINNLKNYVKRITNNSFYDKEIIGIISAGFSELDLVSIGFILLLINDQTPLPRIDYGINNILKTQSIFEEINKNSANIVTAGMEGILPTIIGSISFKPLIVVPSNVSYGIGKNGKAAMLSILNSQVPGMAIFNITNIYGACIFTTHIIKTIQSLKLKNTKEINFVDSKLNKFIINNKLRNNFAIEQHDKLENIYYESKIAIIYDNDNCLNIAYQLANCTFFKKSIISVDLIKIDLIQVIIDFDKLQIKWDQYDIIIFVVDKNAAIVSIIGSILNNVENRICPLICLPLEMDTFRILLNNCINGLAVIAPNNLLSCQSLILSILKK